MSKPDLKKIAAIVLKERTKKGWSQEKLGQEAGVATNTVWSIEKASPTMWKSRDKVGEALGLELD